VSEGSAFFRIAAQALAYGVFFAVVGYFSSAPTYSSLPPGMALLRVSFSHAGKRSEPCRRYTPEEIAATAPNMRRALDCKRGRVTLRLEVDVDGKTVLARDLPPSGLSGDGATTVYGRFTLAPGSHRVVARLRDSPRAEGFDHVGEFELQLAVGESRVLGFRPQDGGFRLL
jgi:hypothetical protein